MIDWDLQKSIILLVLGAIIAGFQFLGKEIYFYWKKYKEKRKIDIENKKSQTLKNKEIFNKLEELNIQENIYRGKENDRMMENNMAVLQNQKSSSDIINNIIINTEVDRFVLFHTHNGNGQPNYFKPYKVSYLQYNAVNPSLINRYQNLEVDSEYTKMLIEIQNNDQHKICLKVENMDESLLKSIYKKEKIKYAEVYFLSATPTGIIYTSIATTRNINKFDDNDQYEINISISQLKNIFNDEHSRVFKDAIIREENENHLKNIYLEKQQLKEKIGDENNQ